MPTFNIHMTSSDDVVFDNLAADTEDDAVDRATMLATEQYPGYEHTIVSSNPDEVVINLSFTHTSTVEAGSEDEAKKIAESEAAQAAKDANVSLEFDWVVD